MPCGDLLGQNDGFVLSSIEQRGSSDCSLSFRSYVWHGDAIDIAFVGREGRVMESYENVPPWQLRKCPGAYAVLERRASGEDSSGSSGEDRVVGWFKKGDEIELCVTK